MCGLEFQKRYSHEFSKVHNKLFERICKGASKDAEQYPTFPREVPASDKGASRKGLVQASWVKDNRAMLRRNIAAFAPSKRARYTTTPAEDQSALDEWSQYRTSYTLRNFKEGDKKPKRRAKRK